MHILKRSWNHSLAAVAAVSLLAAADTPATDADGPDQIVATAADQAGSDDRAAAARTMKIVAKTRSTVKPKSVSGPKNVRWKSVRPRSVSDSGRA